MRISKPFLCPCPLKTGSNLHSVMRGKLVGVELIWKKLVPPPTNTEGGYFRVELPSGRRLVHRMRSGLPFNVQFGRYVTKSRVLFRC